MFALFIQTARPIANKILMNQSNVNITRKLQQQSEYLTVAHHIPSTALTSIASKEADHYQRHVEGDNGRPPHGPGKLRSRSSSLWKTKPSETYHNSGTQLLTAAELQAVTYSGTQSHLQTQGWYVR